MKAVENDKTVEAKQVKQKESNDTINQPNSKDFGFKKMCYFVIDTPQKLKLKL